VASGETKKGSVGATYPSFRRCFALALKCLVTCAGVITEGRDGSKEQAGLSEFMGP
jgi:hypothetical protein